MGATFANSLVRGEIVSPPLPGSPSHEAKVHILQFHQRALCSFSRSGAAVGCAGNLLRTGTVCQMHLLEFLTSVSLREAYLPAPVKALLLVGHHKCRA